MFDAINLDGLTVDPKGLDNAAIVLRQLATYADYKADAMRSRIAGNVVRAIQLEATCEAIYGKLPEWARW